MQTIVVSVATLAAAALLGLVLAYWTWAWLAPRPEPRAPVAVDPIGRGAPSASGLFGTVPRERSLAFPAGTAIKLLGIAASAGGHGGHAVVQLDDRRILAVQEGEDLTPGVRLAEVHPDHLVLERNGMREILAWKKGE